MKWALAMLMTTLLLSTATATFVDVQRLLIDRVADAAKTGLPTAHAALDILERLTEGRMDSISPNVEAQVGLEPGQLHGPAFKLDDLRAYALRKIGELDLPEAFAYIKNLKRADILPDTSGRMTQALQIAVRQSQLNRIPDGSEKIRFLEDVTSERSAAAWWAVDELCNRGSSQSRSFIREYVRRADPARGTEEFCEARIEILSRNPDRIQALGSFLTVSSGVTDAELLGWAINQLWAIKSARADAELARYANEIDGLPENSSLKAALLVTRFHLRNLPGHHLK